MYRTLLLVSATVFSSLYSLSSQAAVLFLAEEVENDVVFTYSGSINLTGLGTPGSFGITSTGSISPQGALLGFADATNIPPSASYQNLSISGPSNFGTGSFTVGGILSPGSNQFAFLINQFSISNTIFVASDYVSESPLSGSFTFENQTFSSLGVDNSQSYEWTLDANGDTFALQFGAPSVPESSNLLGILIASGVGINLKRRLEK